MRRVFLCWCVALLVPATAFAQRRLVIIDQDALAASDSGVMAILALLQAPNVTVLGITMVTGDGWRDEGMQHTLRMLELTGHKDVPVVPGAVYPLVRTMDETKVAAQAYGRAGWLGAWGGET